MGTCGCCGDDAAGGDCSEALTPIRCCRPVYQGSEAKDLVRGPDLQRIIDALVDGHNNQAAALAAIMGPDCTLKDKIILCRHLSDEIGVSCLVDGQVIPPVPPPPGPLPGGPVLDYPGLNLAYAGWSFRRLKTNYTGPAIQVRRALDNATQDIGFAANNLIDTAAMIAFSAGSDLFVQRVYEQVGQGPHDLIQTTPSRQPKIYDSITGFVTNASGRLAAKFDNVDDYLAGENADLPYSTIGLYAIATEWHEEQNGHLIDYDDKVGGSGSAPLAAMYKRPGSTSQYFDAILTIPCDFSVTYRLNEPWLLTWAVKEDGSPVRVEGRLNGSLKNTSLTGGFTGSGTSRLVYMSDDTLGSIGAGYFQEIIYYNDIDWEQILPDLGVPLVDVLETNMMSTWGITPD